MPCSQCVVTGNVCKPQAAEFIKRATHVQNQLFLRLFDHDDLAMFTLYTHSVRTHQRVLFKRAEIKDIAARVEIMYPSAEADKIPQIGTDKLPPLLKEMVKGAYKVEWFYKGDLTIAQSYVYQSRYSIKPCGVKRVFPKIVDTMGFAKPETALRLWLESVHRPGQVVKYEGVAYHQASEKTAMQTARMLTVVFDYEHLITVTTIV